MEQIHLIDPLAAGEEDRRQLVRLWEECFEADEPYLQVYREQMLVKSDARTVVLREQGKILGMLTLLPCSYRVEGRQLPAMYLFAVATLPEAQGKQVATRMLSWVDRFLPQQGIEVAILAPATESLYSFYRKRGYEDWFYRSKLTLPAGQTGQKGLVWEEIGAQLFAQQLERMAGQDAVLWSAQELEFAEAESRLYHGGMYRLWQEGYQVVEGVKASRGKENPLHTFAARRFYAILSRATGIDMSRASDFKLLDRRAVDTLLAMREKNAFFRALSSWIGFRTTQVEFEVQPRLEGQSKWSLRSLIRYAVTNITSFSFFTSSIHTKETLCTGQFR